MEKRKLKIRRRIGPDEAVPYSEEMPGPENFGKDVSYIPPARELRRHASWAIEAVEPEQARPKREKHARKRHKLFGNKKIKAPKPPPSESLGEPQAPAAQKKKAFIFPWRKEKQPEVSPLESGAVAVPDLLAPASVDFSNRDYVIVDGIYHAYLYITGYGYTTVVGNGWLNPLVEAGEDVNLSFFMRRQPKDKILSGIAKTTMINRSRMRDVGDTRQDYEELDSAISSGLYLKENINRNGEDFYYMHTLIEIVAPDPDTLEQRVSAVETLSISLDITCRRCDYRQEQAFLSSLPILALDADIERKSRRNVLTTGIAAAFPFSSFEICDQNGIMLGINLHNRSVCMLDIFDATKYANANMSLLDMSGAGKTFLLQLIAMRLRQQEVQVMILAPLKGFEFRPACEAIGGRYIKISPSSGDCINIMEIRRSTLDTDAELGRDRGDSLLADKIAKLHIFFALLKPNISDEERNYLDTALVDCYRDFGISHDNASLYDEAGGFKIMPTLKDLFERMRQDSTTKSLSVVLSRFVTGSASRLGGHTNIDLENKYIVMDISEMGKDLLPLGMFLALDYCWDKCKESRVEKKALMLDELWCLIGASSNPLAADYVLEIFKVIRGYGGSAICATQDLNDFFALESGKYGKAIINNSRTKIVLPLEEDEAMRVKEVLGLSDEETTQIIRNKRGEGLLCAGRNRISVAFQSTRLEYDNITTQRSDLERQVRERG
ncbi:hypothetical protein FACS1894191_2920 [Clostridia bacterium]|nr:hypothetical protein FACS1894191_2920 [Clostridia bacterium]